MLAGSEWTARKDFITEGTESHGDPRRKTGTALRAVLEMVGSAVLVVLQAVWSVVETL
jgi:hypothetical protein